MSKDGIASLSHFKMKEFLNSIRLRRIDRHSTFVAPEFLFRLSRFLPTAGLLPVAISN